MPRQKQGGGFSTRLRFKLDLIAPALYRSGSSIPEGRNVGERFMRYLFTLHSIIRSSTPLMKAAEAECTRVRNDALRSALGAYYRKHTKEEMGHDEWLLQDLESIGIRREETLAAKPSEKVAELVGSQYYWIHHWHPVSLMGYIAVLEGYPPQKGGVKRLMRKTGHPPSAFRTLAEHSDLDQLHLKELDATLDELPLSARHEEWITLNAIYTVKKCTEILGSL